MACVGRAARYRMQGFARGVNWRPTRFAEDVSHYHICHMCRVLPKRAVLLPCQHSFCDPCHASSIKDGRGVCLLDGQGFKEDQCHWVEMPAGKSGNLKAHCWNEDNGCSFVGDLQAMLQHFEEQCSFHEVTCPQCGSNMLKGDRPKHCATGCSNIMPLATPAQHPQHKNTVKLTEMRAPLKDPSPTLEAREMATVPVLETRMNELVEQTRVHELRLKEIGIMLAAILETPDTVVTQSAGKLSAALAAARREEQCVSTSHQKLRMAEGNGASGGITNGPPLGQHQESTHIFQNIEATVIEMLDYLKDIRFRASTYNPLIWLQKLERPAHPSPLDGKVKKVQHFLLKLPSFERLLYEKLNGSGLSTVFRGCHQQQTCFRVRVGRAGNNFDRLEVAFFSSNSCETHQLAKAMTVEMTCDYGQREYRYSFSEEKDDRLAAVSRRPRLFYLSQSQFPWQMYMTRETSLDIAVEE